MNHHIIIRYSNNQWQLDETYSSWGQLFLGVWAADAVFAMIPPWYWYRQKNATSAVNARSKTWKHLKLEASEKRVLHNHQQEHLWQRYGRGTTTPLTAHQSAKHHGISVLPGSREWKRRNPFPNYSFFDKILRGSTTMESKLSINRSQMGSLQKLFRPNYKKTRLNISETATGTITRSRKLTACTRKLAGVLGDRNKPFLLQDLHSKFCWGQRSTCRWHNHLPSSRLQNGPDLLNILLQWRQGSDWTRGGKQWARLRQGTFLLTCKRATF